MKALSYKGRQARAGGGRVIPAVRNPGFAVRSGYVLGGKANDWVPQEGCNVAVDHLLDLALVTHPKVSPIKRLANQEVVIARGQKSGQ